MKRRKKAKDTSAHGNRYNKGLWEPVVRKMLDGGATYGEIATMLNTSHSTITRFIWELGLASHDKHRHSVRAKILQGKKPNVLRPTKV